MPGALGSTVVEVTETGQETAGSEETRGAGSAGVPAPDGSKRRPMAVAVEARWLAGPSWA
jgi:hypothetical protein